MPGRFVQTSCTLRKLIESFVGRGDRPAIIVVELKDVTQWSFAQLADHVERLARGLAKRGVGPGRQVALLAQNRPEWVAAALAVTHAGVGQKSNELAGH